MVFFSKFPPSGWAERRRKKRVAVKRDASGFPDWDLLVSHVDAVVMEGDLEEDLCIVEDCERSR